MRLTLRHINYSILILYVLLIFPQWNHFLRPSAVVSGRKLGSYFKHVRLKSQQEAQVRLINLLMPGDYKEMIAFMQNPVGRDPQALSVYIEYYRALSQALPEPLSADAYAMQGFCYANQNDFPKAAENFQKSITINPAFLWTYFNLAYVYFQEEKYQESAQLIGRMMTINSDLSMKVLSGSKIYTDILREYPHFDFNAHLAKTYSDGMRMLIISQYRLENFADVVSASKYALAQGMAPADFFQFYAAVASSTDDDRLKADTLLLRGQKQEDNPYAGQDIHSSFF